MIFAGLTKNIEELCSDTKPPGQVVPSPRLILSVEGNKSLTLETDIQGRVFRYLSSINDQVNFARTNKPNYDQFNAFYRQKNSNNNPKVVKLRSEKLSELQIFIEISRERNSLAFSVLGPNAMAAVDNGLLSREEAKKSVDDFYKETSNMKPEDQAVERYRRDGILSEADIEKMTSEDKLLLARSCAQFAINSRQLEIEQVFEKRGFLDKLSWVHSDVDGGHRGYSTLVFLLMSSKLTVKRYLELDTHRVKFITSFPLNQSIERDEITVESALFLLELMDTYKESGWLGLTLMMTSNNAKPEA